MVLACIFVTSKAHLCQCLLVGDGYFNALGYVSGILANTHGWLKNAPDPDNATLVKKSKLYVSAISCLTITICFLCFAPGWPLAFIGTHPAGILFGQSCSIPPTRTVLSLYLDCLAGHISAATIYTGRECK